MYKVSLYGRLKDNSSLETAQERRAGTFEIQFSRIGRLTAEK